MSIAYPIAMPAMPPGPKQITLAQNFMVGEYDSAFTGQGQIYEQPGSWWTAKVDLPFLTRAQAAPWLAFFAALNGRSGTFLFGDPTVLAPLGSAGGTPSVNSAGQTGKVLTIANLTGVLKAGDYFQIGGENRVIWSQAFENAAWVYSNVTRPTADTIVAPDGTTTAEALVATATTGWVVQDLANLTNGQTYTFSIWLKVPAGTKSLPIQFNEPSNAFTCALTTSWQRFSVTCTIQGPPLSGRPGPYIRIGDGNTGWTGSGEVDAWGAQVELGSGVGLDYFPTTSAPQASIRRLYLNLSDQSGTPAVLDIFPRLRESPLYASGYSGFLVFAKPQGQFRLDSNACPWTVDTAGHYSISFGAREAF
ncbi:MAG TPA: hypothetical protein VN921_01470 [Chthoniobacterales bacterium]|nr:hypothetical protein [Chthoniobacterales bacterium]